MGIFKRLLASSEPSQLTVRPLSSGRRLSSELALADCMATLEAVIRGYSELKSMYRTAYVVPGWQWNGGSASAPDTVISFDDTDSFPLFVAFWPSQTGTECALFPLGSGDERLMAMPIIGQWKQRDPTLTSIGLVPQGLLMVASPRLPDRYLNEILETAAFPASPRNLTTLGLKIAEMFGIKGWEFINAKDPRGAEAFIHNHAYDGRPVQSHCKSILNDIASWRNGALLPYIQDLPMRCRAFLLERLDDAESSFWNEFER